ISSITGGSGWSNLTEDRTAAAAGTWDATASSSPGVGDWAIQLAPLAPAALTVTADQNGNYTFTGLANGSYTVTPSKTGSTFNPTSQAVTINGASVTSINFTDTAVQTFSISGVISPAASGSAATVTLSGAASATATV